jgi:hypothetical protein
MRKVTAPTSTVNFNHSGEIPSKINGDKEANNNTIAIFIRLFATNMVANNFLGFESNFSIKARRFEGPSSSSDFKSEEDSEKNAISEPEIRAEKKSKTNNITMLVI